MKPEYVYLTVDFPRCKIKKLELNKQNSHLYNFDGHDHLNVYYRHALLNKGRDWFYTYEDAVNYCQKRRMELIEEHKQEIEKLSLMIIK